MAPVGVECACSQPSVTVVVRYHRAVAKMRWGSDAPKDTETARARLLDAAEGCFRRRGVAKTTVEDVAAAAQVSRATVYRYFPDRDALVLGVLLRDAERFLRRLQGVIDAEPDFEQAVVRGVLYTVDAVAADDNLARLFAPEASGITTAIAGASDALFGLVTAFLRPLLQAASDEGVLRAGVDIEDGAEWILRTVLSLLAVTGPVRRGVSDTQRLLATFLVPALVERSAPAGHGRGGRPVASAGGR